MPKNNNGQSFLQAAEALEKLQNQVMEYQAGLDAIMDVREFFQSIAEDTETISDSIVQLIKMYKHAYDGFFLLEDKVKELSDKVHILEDSMLESTELYVEQMSKLVIDFGERMDFQMEDYLKRFAKLMARRYVETLKEELANEVQEQEEAHQEKAQQEKESEVAGSSS